jgi:hypothetical protein
MSPTAYAVGCILPPLPRLARSCSAYHRPAYLSFVTLKTRDFGMTS